MVSNWPIENGLAAFPAWQQFAQVTFSWLRIHMHIRKFHLKITYLNKDTMTSEGKFQMSLIGLQQWESRIKENQITRADRHSSILAAHPSVRNGESKTRSRMLSLHIESCPGSIFWPVCERHKLLYTFCKYVMIDGYSWTTTHTVDDDFVNGPAISEVSFMFMSASTNGETPVSA